MGQAMGFWNSFWDIIWWFFWIFAFTAYLFVLFSIVADLFRDHKLNGWWKAVWIVFLIFMPFLAALVYLIARGRGMAERSVERREPVQDDSAEYIRSVSFANPAEEITKAKALLDQGTISQGEFDALKAKALGDKF
jgi:predicted PurR-regulated permease PerM